MSVHPLPPLKGRRRYAVRWEEGVKADGRPRQRSKTFNRRDDADAFDREITRRKQLGPLAVTQFTAKGITLARWITDYWSPEHGVTLEVKTRDRYAFSYQAHIEQHLGHLPLLELTVSRLRQWQADLLKDGVSWHSITKARTFLSGVLTHAASSEVIPGNTLLLVKPPKKPHSDQVIPVSPTQVEQIRAILPVPRDRAIVSVLAYTGMRPGELRALRWGDVGVNTIRVQNGSNPDGSLKATKTKRGQRNVRLLPALAEDLAAWRTESGGGRGRQRVFGSTGADGGLTEEAWGDWRNNVWNAARDEIVDFQPTPYHLRHSFASLLLAEGRSIHYVAEQLGHDPSLTLDTYGHLIAEYADSQNITVDDEIAKARANVAARPPVRREPGLGARQREILARAAANPAGLRLAGRDARNDVSRAQKMVTRGLLTRDDTGTFHATDRGHEIARTQSVPVPSFAVPSLNPTNQPNGQGAECA